MVMAQPTAQAGRFCKIRYPAFVEFPDKPVIEGVDGGIENRARSQYIDLMGDKDVVGIRRITTEAVVADQDIVIFTGHDLFDHLVDRKSVVRESGRSSLS